MRITVYNDDITGNTLPSGFDLCEGEDPAVFGASTPVGGNGVFTYLWQVSVNGGAYGPAPAPNNTANYDAAPANLVAVGGAVTTYDFRRLVTMTVCGSVNTSAPMRLTVHPGIANNTLPADIDLCEGEDPSPFLAATPTGGDGVYTYLWEVSVNGGPWSSAPSVNNGVTYDESAANLPLVGGATTTYDFRRKVYSGVCLTEAISSPMRVTVHPAIAGNNLPADGELCEGEDPAPFAAPGPSGADGSFSYLWEVSVNGGPWQPAPAPNTGVTYDEAAANLIAVGGAITTYDYRRTVISNACLASDVSVPLRLTVNPSITDNTLPADQDICNGDDPAAFFASAPSGGDGNLTYQWEWSTDNGASWSSAPSTPNNDINYDEVAANVPLVGGVTTHYDFRRRVSSAGCLTDNVSPSLRLSVNPDVAGNTLTDVSPVRFCGDDVDISAIMGSTPLSLSGGNGTYTYEWHMSQNGGPWQIVDDSVHYDPPFLQLVNDSTTTYRFRRTVNSGGCANEDAITSELTVISPKHHVELFQTTRSAMIYECTQDGWTYYTDEPLLDKFFLAIEKGTNTFTATGKVGITGDGNFANIEDDVIWDVVPSVPGSIGHGSFVMRRYWNVDITSGSLVTPVKVRFYWHADDANNVLTLREQKRLALAPDATNGPWQWFKTIGQDFHPNLIQGTGNGNDWPWANQKFDDYPDGTYYFELGVENGVNYVDLFNVTSFSGGTGGAAFGSTNPLLPVELVSFNATARERDILLDWLTASEVNNEKFVVYRSVDGVNFTEIGEVPGAGTTSEPQVYELADNRVEYNTLYYYRLKQVDFDGREEWSPIVSAIITSGLADVVVGPIIPNPTKDMSHIDLVLPRPVMVNVRIMNMLGQEIVTVERVPFEPGNQRIQLDATSLTKGNYLVSIEFEGGLNVVRKLVVIE